jgi:hypothetical protein
MRSTLFLLLSSLLVYKIQAQLVITPGTQFSVAGNSQLILHNTDLINNGSITTGNSVLRFTGNTSSTIGGSQLVQFHQLEINKTNNSAVLLQQTIGVRERIFFLSGFLDLNGFNADLGTTGRLENEDEAKHIIGPNGGQVQLRTAMNAPASVNPGNLGAVISSSQNLGNVTIRRGHQSQSGSGFAKSIFRYYEIVPENNTNLGAALQINYLTGELNGLDENSFVFFKSNDGISWSNESFDSRNVNGNFIYKTGINSFSKWTLSNDLNSLFVQFILFNAKCENNHIVLAWKTAREQNSNRFDIEKSTDGILWTVIGSLPAAGNSSSEKTYSFSDTNPTPNSFYRITALGLDGRKQLTTIPRTSCGITNMFNLWPNPTHDKIFINIVTNKESQAAIRLFDSKGALVKMQQATVLVGSNQLTIDMRSLASGVYHVSVGWNDGQLRKTISVLKQ